MKEVLLQHSNLGLAQYFSAHIHALHECAELPRQFTQKNVKNVWAEELQAACIQLTSKGVLISPPWLALPDVRADAPVFVLAADTSDFPPR